MSETKIEIVPLVYRGELLLALSWPPAGELHGHWRNGSVWWRREWSRFQRELEIFAGRN